MRRPFRQLALVNQGYCRGVRKLSRCILLVESMTTIISIIQENMPPCTVLSILFLLAFLFGINGHAGGIFGES